jgi:hypothetical protein
LPDASGGPFGKKHPFVFKNRVLESRRFPSFIDTNSPLNDLYDFSSLYLSFYASSHQLKNQVIQLISGKLGEILFFSKISRLTILNSNMAGEGGLQSRWGQSPLNPWAKPLGSKAPLTPGQISSPAGKGPCFAGALPVRGKGSFAPGGGRGPIHPWAKPSPPNQKVGFTVGEQSSPTPSPKGAAPPSGGFGEGFEESFEAYPGAPLGGQSPGLGEQSSPHPFEEGFGASPGKEPPFGGTPAPWSLGPFGSPWVVPHGHEGRELPSPNRGVYTTYGLSNTWSILASLIVSFVQKRLIYYQNLIVPKLFCISNYTSLNEPPSPSSSNILLPARRYENYKRSFSFYSGLQNSSPQSTGIFEKLQQHQQQRLVKRLYNFPIQESYRSEIMSNRMTNFSNSALMFGSLATNLFQKPSRSNWFMKNRILMRHRNYLTNQWWNGQLSEHNIETTFLSDIDWRFTFVDSVGDLLLDFPDSDSHYNPCNRRWFLTKGLTHNWFDFEKTIYSEIYSHLIFDSFIKAFHLYEKNREILDYYAFYSLKNGLFNISNDFETVKLYQRFFSSYSYGAKFKTL